MSTNIDHRQIRTYNGGEFYSIQGDMHHYMTLQDANKTALEYEREAMHTLYQLISPGGLPEGAERADPPRCHRNTRIKIIQYIKDWIDDRSPECPLVLWLNGPAGGGKSAIMYKVTEDLAELSTLDGAFFFFRISKTGANDHSKLIPTLAYQILRNVDGVKPFVYPAVVGNPALPDSSMEAQATSLIVNPLLKAASANDALSVQPRVILIDGLDECIDQEAQERIVKLCFDILERLHGRCPHKVIIASRPETQIQYAFAAHPHERWKSLALDSEWGPDDDIRLFVRSEADILHQHPIFKHDLQGRPHEKDIDWLVERSSGQFIYVATVMKHLKSSKGHPIVRLQDIINLTPPPSRAESPYATLDTLYSHILEQIPQSILPATLVALKFATLGNAAITLNGVTYPYPSIHSLSGSATRRRPVNNIHNFIQHLNLTKTELLSFMEPIQSLVKIDQSDGSEVVSFHHASLPDFLLDPVRSGAFFINSETNIFQMAMQTLMSSSSDSFISLWVYLYALPFIKERSRVAALEQALQAKQAGQHYIYHYTFIKDYVYALIKQRVQSPADVKDFSPAEYLLKLWVKRFASLFGQLASVVSNSPLGRLRQGFQLEILLVAICYPPCIRFNRYPGFDHNDDIPLISHDALPQIKELFLLLAVDDYRLPPEDHSYNETLYEEGVNKCCYTHSRLLNPLDLRILLSFVQLADRLKPVLELRDYIPDGNYMANLAVRLLDLLRPFGSPLHAVLLKADKHSQYPVLSLFHCAAVFLLVASPNVSLMRLCYKFATPPQESISEDSCDWSVYDLTLSIVNYISEYWSIHDIVLWPDFRSSDSHNPFDERFRDLSQAVGGVLKAEWPSKLEEISKDRELSLLFFAFVAANFYIENHSLLKY